MRAALGCLLLASCGRIGFDPLAGGADAALSCRWSPPELVADVSSPQSDIEPTLSPDGQTLVFVSHRLGSTARIFVSRRTGGTWSTPALDPMLDSNTGEGGPTFNATGDTLYFASYRAGPLHIYASAFAGGVFAEPVIPAGLEPLAESIAPSVRADELELFYSSRLPPSRIEYATRSSNTAAWEPQGAVAGLPGDGFDGYPGLSADGLTLYYESILGTPSQRIVRSTRASFDAPFGPASIVPELEAGGSAIDGDPDLGAGGTTLVMASDRTGMSDIYLSTLSCE